MRAIICGAGIAGLTLAWWLRRDGWDITIVEQATGPREDGYMMDFFGSGYDVAERMGLLPELALAHTRITELSYVDTAGRRTGGVRYSAMSQMMRGRVFSFMRGELDGILRGAFEEAPDIRYGTNVAAVHAAQTEVAVELTDGTRHRADLLVGARWMVPDSHWRIALRDRVMSVANIPFGPTLLSPTMAAASASVVE